MKKGTRRILIIDDDHEDQLLIQRAFSESPTACELLMLDNGEGALDLLRRASESNDTPHPDLIILDLNMPRMSGMDVLEVLRADRRLRRIPVIVFTTSGAEEEINSCYDLGASSFIQKPSSFRGMKDLIACVTQYWFKTVSMPSLPL